jgi:hypothetical protein
VKINDSAAHCDTRHKLTGMKGFVRFIGPGSKPFHDLLSIAVACKQDEMTVEALEVAANKPA